LVLIKTGLDKKFVQRYLIQESRNGMVLKWKFFKSYM
jgi:hypothetical protein